MRRGLAAADVGGISGDDDAARQVDECLRRDWGYELVGTARIPTEELVRVRVDPIELAPGVRDVVGEVELRRHRKAGLRVAERVVAIDRAGPGDEHAPGPVERELRPADRKAADEGNVRLRRRAYGGESRRSSQ